MLKSLSHTYMSKLNMFEHFISILKKKKTILLDKVNRNLLYMFRIKKFLFEQKERFMAYIDFLKKFMLSYVACIHLF